MKNIPENFGFANTVANMENFTHKVFAFVQTVIWRTRSRCIGTLQRIQNTEGTGLLEKGAFPADDGESAFFYVSSNLDDFGDLCDTSISIAEILKNLSFCKLRYRHGRLHHRFLFTSRHLSHIQR